MMLVEIDSRGHSDLQNRVVLFIYHGMGRQGGIQSIVVRQVEIISKYNGKVRVICDTAKPVAGLPIDTLIDIDQTPNEILLKVIAQGFDENISLEIIAFSPEAAPIGYLLQQEAYRNSTFVDARLCMTILHPRDLMRETEKWHVHVLNKVLAFAIGPQNLVFMNEQCRATHSAFLARDLSANPIVPVPIDHRLPRWAGCADQKSVRIVLVGRIVNFKAYNFALPAILAQFSAQGLSVICDIYGYGTEEGRLKELVRQSGVEDQLRFHGAIPLETFDDLVSGYDLFIGMGTAAVQAAQLGVPTILAIVDDEYGTHGFIDAAPFGNLGEQDASVPRHDLKETIERYIQASPEERSSISRRGITYANRYLADDYVEKLTRTSVPRTGFSRSLAAIYCRFYIWMARDNWLRKTVRFAKGRRTSGKAS